MRAATKRDQGEIPTSRPRAKLSSTGGLPITATDPSRDSIIPSPRNSWKLDGDLSWARAIHAPASLRAPKPLQLTTHPGTKLDVVSADAGGSGRAVPLDASRFTPGKKTSTGSAGTRRSCSRPSSVRIRSYRQVMADVSRQAGSTERSLERSTAHANASVRPMGAKGVPIRVVSEKEALSDSIWTGCRIGTADAP